MIEFDVIITNGYVDKDTISKKCNDGWNFVITLPAKSIHPNALETDKATIFSKYIKSSKDDMEVEIKSNDIPQCLWGVYHKER